MNLSDKPCYPITPEQYYAVDEHPEVTGLTFRERLIISLAGNPALVCLGRGAEEGLIDYELTVLRISQLASKLISREENE